MKRFIISLMIIFISCGVLFMPHKCDASGWAVGIDTFYAWWEPPYKDNYHNFKYDKNQFYVGPIISLTFFENWALEMRMCFAVGDTNMEYDHQGTGEISATDYNIHVATDSTPAELDFSLIYKIDQQFKIFIEYKASGETAAFYDDDDITITSPYEKSAYDDWDREGIINQGPALGIKYTVLLFNNAALILSTSALYTSTELTINDYYENATNNITAQQKKYSYKGIGNNSAISLSYFIEPLRTAISVGGRFQVLKYFAESGSPSLSNDYFYGITASAMLLF